MSVVQVYFAGHSKLACYDHFHVGTPSTKYRLTIGGYHNLGIGAAGDVMIKYHDLIYIMVYNSPLMTEAINDRHSSFN